MMLLKKHSRNLTNMKARKLFRITFQSKSLLSSKKFQKKFSTRKRNRNDAKFWHSLTARSSFITFS